MLDDKELPVDDATALLPPLPPQLTTPVSKPKVPSALKVLRRAKSTEVIFCDAEDQSTLFSFIDIISADGLLAQGRQQCSDVKKRKTLALKCAKNMEAVSDRPIFELVPEIINPIVRIRCKR